MEEIAANITAPAAFEFKPSATDKVKIGVWTKCVIKKDELYGPFVGERKKLSEVLDGTYSWEIRGPKGRRIFSIDASDPSKGNWMRYVKTARYFDQQNMTAIQKDKQIFYKTLKKIPKGAELLCWYKEERPIPDPKESKSKSKESKEVPDAKSKIDVVSSKTTGSNDETKVTENEDEIKDDSKPSAGGKEICKTNSDKEICKTNSKKETCKTNSSKNIKDSAVVVTNPVQGACIKLSGLTDSIQQVIATTTSSAIEIRNREPVVRLVPLSAEIKLKVHLDLDIRLDADLKMTSCQEDSKKEEYPMSSKLEFHSDEYCHQLTKCEHTDKSMTENRSAILLKEKKVSTPVAYVKGVSIKQEKKCIDISLEEEERSITVKEEKRNITVKEEKKNGIDDPVVNVSNDQYDHDEEIQIKSKSDEQIVSGDLKDAISNELKPVPVVNEIKQLKLVEQSHVHVQKKAESDSDMHDDLESHVTSKDVEQESGLEIDTVPPYAIDGDDRLSISTKEVELKELDKELTTKSKCENIIKEKCKVSDVGNNSKIDSTSTISANNSIVANYTAAKVEKVHHDSLKIENTPGSSKEGKVRLLKKKKKRFCCKICSREFRKPFHLKMHIIRTHEKRERKFRQYIISKREIIRTRSKSYLDEAKRRSLLEHSRPRDNQPSNQVLDNKVSSNDNKVPSNDSTDMINDLSIRKALPSQDIKFHSADIEKTIFSSEDMEKHYSTVDQFPSTTLEVHECRRCKRKFQYKSWLNRHLEYHQKQDLLVQQRSKVPIDSWSPMNAIKSKTPDKIHVVFGQKSSESVSPKERPYSCSECGKQFTTKKNCRRHRRLIHNILVRPERTKLHYTNYTVETDIDDSPGMTKDEVKVDQGKSFKAETKLLNRWKAEAKARKIPTSDPSMSTGIAVRLFDPSRLNLPEKTSQSPTKIQWGVSSNRTGPPPASTNPYKAYRKILDQKAALNYTSSVSNPWSITHKPNPFIPKKIVVEKKKKTDEKKTPHTSVQKPTDLIVPMVLKKQDMPNKSRQKVNSQRLKRPIDMSSVSTASAQDAHRLSSSPNKLAYRPPTLIHHRDIPINHVQNQIIAMQTEKPVVKQDRSVVIPTLKRKLELKQEPIKVQRQRELLPPKLVPIPPQGQYVNPQPAPLLSIPSVIQKPRPAATSAINPKPHTPQTPKKDTMERNPMKSQKKTFTCNVCNMVFATFLQVNQHVSLHAEQFPFKCEICAKLFQVPQQLVYHRNTHTSVIQTQSFPCNLCNGEFPTKKLLDEHNIYVHRQSVPRTSVEILQPKLEEPVKATATTYKCTKCSREFLETAPFHSHIIDCALSGM